MISVDFQSVPIITGEVPCAGSASYPFVDLSDGITLRCKPFPSNKFSEKRLTEVSSEIMKVPQEFFVTTIKEVSDKNFGIGGKTIDKVKEEYMKKHQ